MLSPDALPDSAKPVTDAALAWLNTQSGRTYSLTGVFGVEDLAELRSGKAVELGLVVCDGELCAREQVEVGARVAVDELELDAGAGDDAFRIAPAADAVPAVPRHEHELVIVIERGLGIRAREGLSVRVKQRGDDVVGLAGRLAGPQTRALPVDLAKVLDGPLVDLNRDLNPGPALTRERHDVACVRVREARQLRAQNDHRIFGDATPIY